MKRKWVVFFFEDRELLRYSLEEEGEDERLQTIDLLAYENGLEPEEISFMIV